MSVNYDFLIGKRVKLVGGYQKGATGTVVRPTFVAAGGHSAWVVTVKPDEGYVPTGVLGTDPDGMLIASLTAGHLEALEEIPVPNENGVGIKWEFEIGARIA